MKKALSNRELKISLLFLILSPFFFSQIMAQTPSLIRKETINNRYSRHTITKLNYLRPDDYDLAINYQLGVIGNDFFKREVLTNNELVKLSKWEPLTGFKETMSGQLHSYYKRTPYRLASEDAEERDDDIHFELIPTMSGSELYKESYRKNNASEIQVGPEIDISDDVYINYLRKYNPNVPKQEIDYVSVYGPWVIDQGHNNLEIHPTEQVWWTNKTGSTNKYHLYSFFDASSRWPFGEWTGNPFHTTFAIAVKGKVNAPKIKLDINYIGSKNLAFNSADGKKHYLIYSRDTLAIVNEFTPNDILDIKFERVGLDPTGVWGDSTFTGFIVISSKLKTNGALLINCNLNDRKNIEYDLLPRDKYRITLENIVCDQVDDFNDTEDIFGYIGVQVESKKNLPIGSTILSSNSNSSLLWFRRDGNHISLKKNQSIPVNSYLDFYLDASDSIKIKSDLDENDTNKDYNESVADDDRWFQTDAHADDRLPNGGSVKKIFLKTGSLSINNPQRFTQVFSSGGTKIRINLKVERFKVNTLRFSNSAIDTH